MKKIISCIILLFLLCSMIIPTPLFKILTASADDGGDVYSMSDAQWGIQGSNGWYYYAYDGAAYRELDFDAVSGNRFLVNNDIENNYQYIEIHPNGGHPCADASKSAVRGFKVPADGRIEITWSVAPTNASYYVFDGVSIVVKKNSATVFPASGGAQVVNDNGKPYPSGGDNDFIATPEVFKFEVDASKDEMLYFHLFNNGSASYDKTSYDISIKYLQSGGPSDDDSEPPQEPAVNVYNMSSAQWGVQGSNGWSYYAYDGAAYKELDFDEVSGSRFYVKDDDGSYQYIEIYQTGGHPCSDPAKSAVRGFRIPVDGRVEITWTVAPTNASYYVFDGVGIAALKNGSRIFPLATSTQSVNDNGKPYPSGGDNDFIATPEVYKFEVDVTESDMLYFHLYNNGSVFYDKTLYNITIKYLDGNELTDAQRALADKEALTWDDIRNMNVSQDQVISSLNLVTIGEAHGSLISWSSSDTSVVNTTGQVFRPNFIYGNKSATLTATINKNGAIETKNFVVNVVSLAPSSNAFLASLTIQGASYTPSFNREIYSYSASVGNNIANITINAFAEDMTALTKINGAIASIRNIQLNTGNNVITIEVTAQNGLNKNIYTLNVERAVNNAPENEKPAVGGTSSPQAQTSVAKKYSMTDALWGIQGSNGWFYYAYDGNIYKELDFDDDSKTRFFVMGDDNEQYKYLEIYEDGGHPCEDPSKSSVRGFKVPASGKVEVTWIVAPSNASYYVFDGVGLVVRKNNTKVFPEGFEMQSVNDSGKPYPSGGDTDFISAAEVFKFTVDVVKGDMLYFHLYNNGSASYDKTKYNIVIEYKNLEVVNDGKAGNNELVNNEANTEIEVINSEASENIENMDNGSVSTNLDNKDNINETGNNSVDLSNGDFADTTHADTTKEGGYTEVTKGSNIAAGAGGADAAADSQDLVDGVNPAKQTNPKTSDPVSVYGIISLAALGAAGVVIRFKKK